MKNHCRNSPIRTIFHSFRQKAMKNTACGLKIRIREKGTDVQMVFLQYDFSKL